jgi:hypothetical protein
MGGVAEDGTSARANHTILRMKSTTMAVLLVFGSANAIMSA